jgi:flagellar basal-body rod protein FlgB
MLESAINGSIARQNIIAHNVSNINTPGFKHFVAEFNGQTEQKTLSLKTTSVKHISLNDNELSLTVTQDNSQGRADGNNVDLQKEMTLMVQNDIYFNAAVNQLNKKLAIQRYVLSGSE